MPGTTMPDLLHSLPAAEQLKHFLLAQQPVTFHQEVPDRATVVRSEASYRRVDCIA